MKGVIFTEFLELLEADHSLDFVDELIEAVNLPGGGAYTAVGTYPCAEMVALLECYSARVDKPVPGLLRAFGRHLFPRFRALYPEFFREDVDAFEFVQGIDAYIHMEVLKLYPDAELPNFSDQRLSDDELLLEYQSTRPLAALAEGLLEGCIEYFGESIRVEVEDRSAGAGTRALFRLVREASSPA